jgi:hypothetical protein
LIKAHFLDKLLVRFCFLKANASHLDVKHVGQLFFDPIFDNVSQIHINVFALTKFVLLILKLIASLRYFNYKVHLVVDLVL